MKKLRICISTFFVMGSQKFKIFFSGFFSRLKASELMSIKKRTLISIPVLRRRLCGLKFWLPKYFQKNYKTYLKRVEIRELCGHCFDQSCWLDPYIHSVNKLSTKILNTILVRKIYITLTNRFEISLYWIISKSCDHPNNINEPSYNKKFKKMNNTTLS